MERDQLISQFKSTDVNYEQKSDSLELMERTVEINGGE
jgi:hypothetical protein